MWIQRTTAWMFGALVMSAPLFSPHVLWAQATIANTSIRPFVTGIIPVVGNNGEVGGVAVDAKGVVTRVKTDGTLDGKRDGLLEGLPSGKLQLRFVSLARLERTFADYFSRGEPVPEDVLFMAGLQRVEYVFVDPAKHDILLAGPAEPWRVNPDGMALGITSGRPTLRLDDLLEAFRTASIAADGAGISCSIDPTEEGLARFQRMLQDRSLRFNARTADRMRKVLGPQRVTISGVLPDSHFARVMVASDYMMKRLAMGLEKAPIEEMPSYMELLRDGGQKADASAASPRFWMAVHYEPLLCSSDRLSWQLRGTGVKVLSEDAYLSESGERVTSSESQPLAAQWADSMTDNYEKLSDKIPVFGQLRNCMDLAVVAALIAHHDLLAQAGVELPLLTGNGEARGPQYEVPTTVESQVSVIPQGKSWLVSVSGGVEVNSWSALERIEDGAIAATVPRAARDGWWWD